MMRMEESPMMKLARAIGPMLLSVVLWLLIFWAGAALAQPTVTRGGALKKRAFQTYSTMSLYVNGDGGSDSNACTSATAACATIQAAVDRIPYWVRHDVTVNVEPIWNSDGGVPGQYAETVILAGHRIGGSSTTMAPPIYQDYPTITITGSNLWYQPTLTGGSTGTVTSYTAPSAPDEGDITDAAGTWSPTGLTTGGNFIRMTSGPADGQRRLITSNTGTALGLNYEFDNAPVAGNTFVIERPSTRILGNFVIENIDGMAEAQKGGIVLQRMDIESNNSALISVHGVTKPGIFRPLGFYDALRPRATVVFDELRLFSTHADTYSTGILCAQASCGFRGNSHLWSSAYSAVFVEDAEFDLGAVYIVSDNSSVVSGDSKAVFVQRGRLMTNLYPSLTNQLPTWGDITQMFPVIEAIGSSVIGMYLLDSTSHVYALSVRAGAAVSPNSVSLYLMNSNLYMWDSLDLAPIRGTTTYGSNWGVLLTYGSTLFVEAGSCGYTAEYCYVVADMSKVRNNLSPSAAVGAVDMLLDNQTYTFATVNALSPAVVLGQEGSMYSKPSTSYTPPPP